MSDEHFVYSPTTPTSPRAMYFEWKRERGGEFVCVLEREREVYNFSIDASRETISNGTCDEIYARQIYDSLKRKTHNCYSIYYIILDSHHNSMTHFEAYA